MKSKKTAEIRIRKRESRGGYILPFLLSVLLLLYIRGASADIVSTDYIRLVNSYLPDTLNPEKFFVKDLFTRIPVSYLLRTINLKLFHYSVNFDRALGVLGLFLSACVIMRYCIRMGISKGFSLLSMLLLFSLNKWEMLLNGSGYAHFLAFFLFYLHFLLWERCYQGTSGKNQKILLALLPFFVLLTAGPYLLVYSVCMVLAYGFTLLSSNRNVSKGECFVFGASVLLPLFLYLLSNHYAVYEYAGAQDIGLITTLKTYPAFSVHFILNGLASMVLSGELLEELLQKGILSMRGVYFIGIGVACAYLLAAYLYLKERFYKKTLFPMLLLLYGIGSHMVVFLSRYVFLRETYAWQSRYALQYQSGILGIILIFALYCKEKSIRGKGGRKSVDVLTKVLILLLSVAFLLGNCYTSFAEIKKMPYREIRYEEMIDTARNLDDFTDEALENIFEYHHGGERIRNAFRILQDNHLNVFYP